ncbi:MAG TPA: peptide-methionine (S)-S-oxide reductase MsrA [Tepidisphaeraceae bacterium]|nr:peptide-methionine (S)-S-oxide reductase MsrA [Tepidisphaeraceae bacterium]
MNRPSFYVGILIMGLTSFFGGCDKPAYAAATLPAPAIDLSADVNAKPGESHTMIVAGGCFWCIEGVFDQLVGVKSVVSGYAGGAKETANYEAVCTGSTGHAESVKITYDPTKITYGELLRVLFTVIDPTTKDRQGPDSGTQYRSAIFYENDDQKKVAEAYIKQLDAAKAFSKPIVTTLEALKPEDFYPAEKYHQNFVACHLNHGYVIQEALPKIAKVREKFKSEVKPEKG